VCRSCARSANQANCLCKPAALSDATDRLTNDIASANVIKRSKKQLKQQKRSNKKLKKMLKKQTKLLKQADKLKCRLESYQSQIQEADSVASLATNIH
jgi:hypothetical protein